MQTSWFQEIRDVVRTAKTMYAIYPKIVLKGVTVDTGGLHVNLTVQRLVFDLLVTKLLVNVNTDVYRDGLVIHVRDIAVQGVLKTFATKMAPAPGDVIKIGRGIFVIVSMVYKIYMPVIPIDSRGLFVRRMTFQ